MNAPPAEGIRRLLAELKRRKVFKVAAVYGAVGFVVLQLSDILVPALELPDSVTRGIALVLVLAFPVALVLAWALEVTPDGVRRTDPATPDEVSRIVAQPKSRRWPIGFAAGVATVALLWAGWWALAGREGASVLAGASDGSVLDDEVLAVLPFAVQGSPEVQYLGEGIVGLLSTKLDGAGTLRSVDGRSILRMVARDGYSPGDPNSALAIASIFGAGLYVAGEIVEAAGRMQVSAALHRAGGEELVQATVDGSSEDVFLIVDELTSRLLSGIRGGPAARVQRIAAVTTSSVPALKSFLEGEEHFRNGQFNEAVESFQRATHEDSLFALAYYRLSIAAEWSLANQTSVAAAETAVRLSDRLSERDRRILEAYGLRRLGQNAEAAVRYRSILGTYPDEMEAWLDLSEIQFHANPLAGQSFTDSRESLSRVLAFDPNQSTALIHSARVAAYENDAPGVDSLSQRFLDLQPEAGRRLEMLAVRAIGTRDSASIAGLDELLREADEAGATLAVWSAGVFAGDLEITRLAGESLVQPRRSPEAKRLGYAYLAHLAAAAEQWDDASAAIENLTALSHGTGLEHDAMLALLPFRPAGAADMRRLREALLRLDPATVETSDNPAVSFNVHDQLHPVIRLYLIGLLSAHLDMADAALAYSDSLRAIEPRLTDGSLPQDLGLGVRAELLRLQGRTEEALTALENQKRHMWYAQTASSPLFSLVRERFVQAELLMELGREEEARRWYETIDQLSAFDLPYRPVSARRLADIASKGDS